MYIAAFRFTARERSHRSTYVLVAMGPPAGMPAAFTTMSIGTTASANVLDDRVDRRIGSLTSTGWSPTRSKTATSTSWARNRSTVARTDAAGAAGDDRDAAHPSPVAHVPPSLPDLKVGARLLRNASSASRWSAVSMLIASNATDRS